jgi:hypothetical protein
MLMHWSSFSRWYEYNNLGLGKITIKGTSQGSGHSLKLHFCMFEISQGKHNNLDCHKKIWNIFH